MKFLMLGKYSKEAIEKISSKRTEKALEIIKNSGGKIESMFALLGSFDLAFIIDFPKIEDAIKTSVELSKLTGIGFTTFPAITIEEFDKLVG